MCIEYRLLQRRSVDRSTIGCQLAAELRVVIWAGLIQCGDITIAATSLAVGLGVVCVEVVAAGECSMAPRHPADVRLLFRVALHVPLQVLLPLEAARAAGLFALELDLLDD